MGQKPIESGEYRSIQALYYVKKALLQNVEAGDEVVIVTDTEHDPGVWKTIATGVHDLEAHPVVTIIEPREMDYYDVPASVHRQMEGVDLIVTCTTKAMLHSKAVRTVMQEYDVPVLCMDGGITMDMLTKGAITADYEQVEEIKYQIARKVFEGGTEARLTSRHGSDLTLSVEGRVFVPPGPEDPPLATRRQLHRGTEQRKTRVFPGGEFNVPPDHTTANGTIVIDTTMHTLGYLEEPITVEVEEGIIQSIEGGYQAKELEDLLENYGDEDAYKMPTEFSVGANPEARVTGVQREDKVMLGCIHVGLGTNADVGGGVESKIHMDGVIARPTLEIDGEVKIDEGRILPLDL